MSQLPVATSFPPEVWLLPVLIVILFFVRVTLKLILFPVRILFWSAILALPVWIVMNLERIRGWLS